MDIKNKFNWIKGDCLRKITVIKVCMALYKIECVIMKKEYDKVLVAQRQRMTTNAKIGNSIHTELN